MGSQLFSDDVPTTTPMTDTLTHYELPPLNGNVLDFTKTRVL